MAKGSPFVSQAEGINNRQQLERQEKKKRKLFLKQYNTCKVKK